MTNCCILFNNGNAFPMNLLGFIKLVLKLNGFLTASPSMRGSTPLDVAAASVMDNNELALALREPDLEKVGSFFIKHFFPPCKEEKIHVSWSKQNQRLYGNFWYFSGEDCESVCFFLSAGGLKS